MKLLADYHVHSRNSRFKLTKSSIEDIARAANAMGLESVAITDHGFKHVFACNKQKLIESRKIVDELNSVLGTTVLLGIEANLLSEDGTLDVDDETLALVDILLIGYHKMIKTDFASFFGKQKDTHEAIAAATDAYCNAIERYDVDIVAHPGHDIKIDMYRLGKTCAANGVMVELNNRHANISQDDMADLLRSGCQFVVSSDSYGAEGVGNVNNALRLIDKYNIPPERVVNVEFDNEQISKDDMLIAEDKKRLEDYKKKVAKNSTLSTETEDKLRVLAKEKGVYIEEYSDDEYFKATLSAEERAVVEQAEAYLRRHGKIK